MRNRGFVVRFLLEVGIGFGAFFFFGSNLNSLFDSVHSLCLVAEKL